MCICYRKPFNDCSLPPVLISVTFINALHCPPLLLRYVCLYCAMEYTDPTTPVKRKCLVMCWEVLLGEERRVLLKFLCCEGKEGHRLCREKEGVFLLLGRKVWRILYSSSLLADAGAGGVSPRMWRLPSFLHVPMYLLMSLTVWCGTDRSGPALFFLLSDFIYYCTAGWRLLLTTLM